MKLYDINLDCLSSLISKVPLEKRLFTLRQVNSQWKTAVEDICKTQTELTLQIGSGEISEWMFKKVKSPKLLINAISPFHSLSAAHLNDELTTFLTSTFPCLQSLAVIVDDEMTETVDFLYYIPLLISAYADTLTTLQLVWKVQDITFQAIFRPLIGRINGLHQLKRLSFVDATCCLEVPPFDLPHLLSTSLETLDFYSKGSYSELARHWEDSLLARQNSKARSELVKINFVTNYTEELPFSHSFPFNVAVHLHSMYLHPYTVADLEHLCSGAFINLQKLRLSIWNVTFSVGDVLVQLSSLPHLTDLTLSAVDLKKIDYPANRPLPVLSAVRWLHLTLIRPKTVHNQVNTEELRSQEVFPNALTISLKVYTHICESCGWKAKWSNDGENGEMLQTVEGGEHLVEQCFTQMASSFVSGNAKPGVRVSCQITGGQGVLPKISHTVDLDDEGRVKHLTKYVQAM